MVSQHSHFVSNRSQYQIQYLPFISNLMEKIKINVSTRPVPRKRHNHMSGMGMKSNGTMGFPQQRTAHHILYNHALKWKALQYQSVSLTSLSRKLRCLARDTASGGLESAEMIPIYLRCLLHSTPLIRCAAEWGWLVTGQLSAHSAEQSQEILRSLWVSLQASLQVLFSRTFQNPNVRVDESSKESQFSHF